MFCTNSLICQTSGLLTTSQTHCEYTLSLGECLVYPDKLLLVSWKQDSYGMLACPPLPTTIHPSESALISCQDIKLIHYLIIASNKLRHRMENSIASELCGCCYFWKPQLPLFLSFWLLFLHFWPNFTRNRMVVNWYVLFIAALLVYGVMITNMSSAARISTGKKGSSLTAFKIFFCSKKRWAFQIYYAVL